ncbi:AAA family ATPase [Komagataeibacter rhaeticus]|nr:AAA family ATPase [Komagataeibacter rhaeticus]
MLTGVAGSGKTALLSPLVDAWKHDTRYDTNGRRVIGIANAWRQADALREAGIFDTSAMLPFWRGWSAVTLMWTRIRCW